MVFIPQSLSKLGFCLYPGWIKIYSFLSFQFGEALMRIHSFKAALFLMRLIPNWKRSLTHEIAKGQCTHLLVPVFYQWDLGLSQTWHSVSILAWLVQSLNIINLNDPRLFGFQLKIIYIQLGHSCTLPSLSFWGVLRVLWDWDFAGLVNGTRPFQADMIRACWVQIVFVILGSSSETYGRGSVEIFLPF